MQLQSLAPDAARLPHGASGGAHRAGALGDACGRAGRARRRLPGYTDVSAGHLFTCAVKENEDVACWGLDFEDEAPPLVTGPFKQVGAGGWVGCGLRTDGTVTCWGSDGDLYQGNATPPGGTFSQISVGWQHSCGLRPNNTVDCWGDYNKGPAVDPAGTYLQVTAGMEHSCAIDSVTLNAHCWGDNYCRPCPGLSGSLQADQRRRVPQLRREDRRHGCVLGRRHHGHECEPRVWPVDPAVRHLYAGGRGQSAHLRHQDRRHPRLLGVQLVRPSGEGPGGHVQDDHVRAGPFVRDLHRGLAVLLGAE